MSLFAEGAKGKAKLKVLPWPTMLSTHIEPLCASTMFLVILKPNPTPSK
jgi:hypothetical protein